MSETMYMQVLLVQGTKHMNTWLPTKGLKIGSKVTLKGAGVDGWWSVSDIYMGTAWPESQVKDNQRLNRNSLPSVKGMQ
jgi:hypothetical protein